MNFVQWLDQLQATPDHVYVPQAQAMVFHDLTEANRQTWYAVSKVTPLIGSRLRAGT
jgi:hypothetical protein